MYIDFYKFQDHPFQLTPDPRFFFGSSVHRRAEAHLLYGLSQGEGFIVVTGDVGAGKTTLVGHLLSTLDPKRYRAARIVSTNLGADDMLRMVAGAFAVPHEGVSKAGLLERIEQALAASLKQGLRSVLLVDEAQNLSVQALEELRMLSNFQVGRQAPLQSFLLAQPQFRRTLAGRDLDQLRQRVIASYHLGPLDREETAAYVRHRLGRVGWTDDPRIDDEALAAVFRHTGGMPRRINTLCSRVLLYGALEELRRIGPEIIDQVADDLEREFETVLDRSPGPEATDGLSGRVEILAKRIESAELRLRRHDRALRMAGRTVVPGE
ncbi:MAG: AAA family ATPase [Alphaproteobacteria bacterium]|nr:AAA family ATPase [Alphaproteobacteria bacterium]